MKNMWFLRDMVFCILAIFILVSGFLRADIRLVIRGCIFVVFAVTFFIRDKSHRTNKFVDIIFVVSVVLMMISDFY